MLRRLPAYLVLRLGLLGKIRSRLHIRKQAMKSVKCGANGRGWMHAYNSAIASDSDHRFYPLSSVWYRTHTCCHDGRVGPPGAGQAN